MRERLAELTVVSLNKWIKTVVRESLAWVNIQFRHKEVLQQN
ncbi:MAG: hypothetical protein QXN83_07700 [Nitrososphaerales archaeon]